MVLKPAHGLLLVLLWFVRGHYTSDNDLDDEDAAADWEDLSALVYQEDTRYPGYFYGRSSHIGHAHLPDSQPVSKAETRKTLFKPENRTQPLPLPIKNMLLQAAALPPTVELVRKLIEILCYIDRMYVRIRKDIFKQDILKDLRYGKCNLKSRGEYYYYTRSLNEDCGLQKEVCTALCFQYMV